MTIAAPANTSLSGCSGGGTPVLSAPDGGSTISFSGGSIGASTICTIVVDVTSSTIGTHTNVSGDLTSSAGNSGTATDDLNVVGSAPGFAKTFSPSSVFVGGGSTLTFTIDNSANASSAFNLNFTDNFPVGIAVASPANAATTCTGGTLTAVAGSSSVSYSGTGSVAAGATCTITVDVTGTAVGAQNNSSGSLSYFNGISTVNSGKANATLTVNGSPLLITKAFTDDPVAPGGTVTLEFTIQNNDRNFPATGVAFTDNLASALAGLTFSSLLANDCGGSITGFGTTTIGLTGGTIASEATCTIRTSLTVPGGVGTGSYTNTTDPVSGTVDGNPVPGNRATDDLRIEDALPC